MTEAGPCQTCDCPAPPYLPSFIHSTRIFLFLRQLYMNEYSIYFCRLHKFFLKFEVETVYSARLAVAVPGKMVPMVSFPRPFSLSRHRIFSDSYQVCRDPQLTFQKQGQQISRNKNWTTSTHKASLSVFEINLCRKAKQISRVLNNHVVPV